MDPRSQIDAAPADLTSQSESDVKRIELNSRVRQIMLSHQSQKYENVDEVLQKSTFSREISFGEIALCTLGIY